jgi:tRNA(Ile)-lysidine synthetase-like protein
LQQSERGAILNLPQNILALKDENGIKIYRKKEEIFTPNASPKKFDKNGFKGGRYEVNVSDEAQEDVDNDWKILKIDADKLPSTAVFRFRKEGDKIETFGGGTKTLKKFFNERKTPVEERSYLPLIADENTDEVYVICGVEISEKVKATGASFIDAPVVKSKPAAIAGKLGIYVGGDERDYEALKPILLYMGENVIRMGDNGKGLVMKICHNALVSQIQNGVNETSTLAAANGIDILTFAQAISYGGAGNWYLDSKKDALAREDYTTAFSVENEHKDVHICLDLAKQCGVSMPGEENAARVYDKALEMGLGKEDFCATIKVVRNDKA